MSRISAPHPGTFDSRQIASKVLVFCLCAEVIILLLDLLINFFQLIDYESIQHVFNVAREQSVGTWFSVVQSAVTGLVLLAIYFMSAEQKRVLGWLVLGCFFLYISVDDAAKIHERLGDLVQNESARSEGSLLGSVGEFFPSYAWQWVFAPFFILMGSYILLFLWGQLPTSRMRFCILAAFSCWGIAVGIDFLEGIDGLFENWAMHLQVQKYTVSHPLLMLEEFLEMFGTTLFLTIFVRILVETVNLALCQEESRPL